jgi:hypothetical protein
MNTWRRFEVLLPLRQNDGQPVSDNAVGDALDSLHSHFGAVSWETQITRGRWNHEGKTYEDESMRIVIDVPDSSENRAFFTNFKGELKVRFQQLDIWMVSHLIEIV